MRPQPALARSARAAAEPWPKALKQARTQAELARYGRYRWWVRAFWEIRFFFPKWRLPASFPRAPIAAGQRAADDITLVFGGDVMVKTGDRPVVFAPSLQETLGSADMFFGALEAPVVARDRDEAVRYPRGLTMPPFAMPLEFLERQCALAGLAPERVCLSVAANHAGDLGVEAFHHGCALLKTRGFQIVGEHVADGRLADIVQIGELRLAILAWTRWMNDDPFEWERPGVNRQFHVDASDLAAELTDRRAGLAIALPHWGYEMRTEPLSANRQLATDLRRAGFGLIVGSHPHMLQPLDYQRGTLCAYSLGNFTYTLSNIAKPGRSWRSCLSGLLEVSVNRTTGAISGYRLIPIVETFDGEDCHLVRLDEYDGPLKSSYDAMVANLFPPSDANHG